MLVMPPQPLPQSVEMRCYACEEHSASHVCRYKVGELAIQVCLCPNCMKLDAQRLLTGAVGIQGLQEAPSANFVAENSPLV